MHKWATRSENVLTKSTFCPLLKIVLEKENLPVTITEIDENVMYRFYSILQTIACGHGINAENFREYAVNFAKEISIKISLKI